jgi:hypothetical protein
LWTLELERIYETQGLLDPILTQVEKFANSNDTEFNEDVPLETPSKTHALFPDSN